MTAERAAEPEVGDRHDALLLGNLLARSAAGDRTAFLEFYDRTSATALRLARLRHGTSTGPRAEDPASEEVLRRYALAWDRAARHAVSGLSPLAWLLSLCPDQGVTHG